jgi:hypothetical protein
MKSPIFEKPKLNTEKEKKKLSVKLMLLSITTTEKSLTNNEYPFFWWHYDFLQKIIIVVFTPKKNQDVIGSNHRIAVFSELSLFFVWPSIRREIPVAGSLEVLH